MSKQLSLDVGEAHIPDNPKRGKHYIEPRGYAFSPGTGPAGETCGTCRFYCSMNRGKRFAKCEKARSSWTHSRRTDVLSRAAACKFWEKKDG